MGGLFTSAFLSATLLPGNSEIALAAWLAAHPATAIAAVGVASIGNTLGSLTTYWLGTRIPADAAQRLPAKAVQLVKRYGSIALCFAWLPVIGDGLCLAGGWLKLPITPSLVSIFAGKFIRYTVVASPWLYKLSTHCCIAATA
jgi:membrane protein YqaA with SNARE-associated domain